MSTDKHLHMHAAIWGTVSLQHAQQKHAQVLLSGRLAHVGSRLTGQEDGEHGCQMVQ